MRLPRGASRNSHEKAVATCTGCPGSTGGRRRDERVPAILAVCCQVIQRVVWLSLRAAAARLRGSSVGRAPSDRRPPDCRRCRRRSSFRTRRGHAHGASVHRAHTPAHTRLEASYRHTPRRLPRSLRSRIRARNSTKVRSPRARGLRTRATSDLMRLTTCAPFPHSYTLAMPPDRGGLRHAPRPRREYGLVAA